MREYEITPCQKIGRLWFKRDDLFRPFDFSPINGSKLRQCMLLCEKNEDKIGGGIITGTSLHSPQAAIVASVARSYGVPCTIGYGGTTLEMALKNEYPRLCAKLGAKIEILSSSGRTGVLQSHVDKRVRDTGEFNIRYGFDLRNNLDCFIDSVAKQVQNIPDNLENLVITIGSSITLIGLLYGVWLYKKKIRNIYGIGCAPNRMEKIRDYIQMINHDLGARISLDNLRYIDAQGKYKGFRYDDTMEESYFGLHFHPRYEAKTFYWLKHSIQPHDYNTLMWITGADINDFNKIKTSRI